MSLKPYVILTLILMVGSLSAQENYAISSIDTSLKENANAIIRESSTRILITSYDEMSVTKKRIVTVLNKEGERNIGAYEFYDGTTKIKKLEAKIYNKSGEIIKKIKKNDFRDVSAVDGGTLYSDDRVKYLEYTALAYPYTVEIFSEIDYSTTAFTRPWLPLENYKASTEYSSYEIVNTSGINLSSKQVNFESFDIKQKSDWFFVAENLKAIKREVYSPDFKSLVPFMKVALEEFDMKGIKGSNKNWNDFGKWMNDNLISNTTDLPQEVIDEAKKLVSKVDSDLEKAKLIYQYVQDKTRYISVQVGIGGWKPIIAEEVDRLGYGDCKGLSNYTRALLEAVGVQSFYTVIYGGRSIVDMDKDFSVTEGNHVILALPNNDDYVWLECTSQVAPFGYIANFTDDRDALIITPDGGKIVHTQVYKASDNLMETSAEVEISENGDITGSVNINTKGSQYYYHSVIERKTLKDQILTYKEDYWDDINRLEIKDINLTNDVENIVFSEQVEFTAIKYGKKSGNRVLLRPNLFNKLTFVPPINKHRKHKIKIDRGYTDMDQYTLHMPDNAVVEAIPKSVEISNEFGNYKFSIVQEGKKILVKRKLVMNKGVFDASLYNDYRIFRKAIAKADKSKIALQINQP